MFTRHRHQPTTPADLLAESRANIDAVTAVVRALADAHTSEDAVRDALEVVRERFGWSYGSYWRVGAV